MLKLSLATQDPAAFPCDVLVLPAFKGAGKDAPVELGRIGKAQGKTLETFATESRFKAEVGETLAVPAAGGCRARTLMFLGLGEKSKANADTLRRAGAALVRRVAGYKKAATTLAGAVELAPEVAVGALAEGLLLGSYRFDQYKSEPTPSVLAEVALLARDVRAAAARKALERARIYVEATFLARDLVNEPAGNLDPAGLAAIAKTEAKKAGLTVKIWDEKDLAREGFGGTLAVGVGSAKPPRLIELRYNPAGAKGRVVLVGKGVTFDSGGLSLKPADFMLTMKDDMSGGAAVIAVMSALGALGVKTEVVGLIPAAENMPSGTATHIGDVARIRGGKTVEILNTDAEGRLLLADAIAYAGESSPDAIVDIATLTGACVVALGAKVAGLFGSDENLVRALLAAAEKTGEPIWHLPLVTEYAKEMESAVADLRNIGTGRHGGAINAALFLKEFVGERSWAHVDIAGPAFAESEDGYLAKGGTGFAVRTLLAWLEAGVD
ncbi:MAG: leucyl aminopeptidase [Actinomycetota bacterium]